MKASAFIRRTHVLSISYHFILSHTQSIKMLVTTNDQYTYAIHQFDSLPKWRRRPTTDKKIIKIELASHRLNIHYTYKPSLKSNLIWLCILYIVLITGQQQLTFVLVLICHSHSYRELQNEFISRTHNLFGCRNLFSIHVIWHDLN